MIAMKICEILSLEEKIKYRKLFRGSKPNIRSRKPKATPKWPKAPSQPARLPAPKPIIKSAPKPFNSPKSISKSIEPKQTRAIGIHTNIEPNGYLKPLPQNVISPRGAVDMDLQRKMDFSKEWATRNSFGADLSNREIDSKTRPKQEF
jgi:hypothetical protein